MMLQVSLDRGAARPPHPSDPRARGAAFTKLFDGAGGDDFFALHAAQYYLRQRGFSFGSSSIGLPVGVMYGRWQIAKWRNMSPREIVSLHGEIAGDFRCGPATLSIFWTAPAAAIAAITRPAFVLAIHHLQGNHQGAAS